MDFGFAVGRQREELRLSVHHPEGKFKPKHRQSAIKEKQGEEEWREGILGQFHPLWRLKGCTRQGWHSSRPHLRLCAD